MVKLGRFLICRIIFFVDIYVDPIGGFMRQTRIVIMGITVFFFFVGLCFAWLPMDAVSGPMGYIVTGTIEKIGRNTIDIRDEDDKVLKRFTYFYGDVAVGERVRIRYQPRSGIVEQLKKMTVVEYKEDGQNLGYLRRESTSEKKDE